MKDLFLLRVSFLCYRFLLAVTAKLPSIKLELLCAWISTACDSFASYLCNYQLKVHFAIAEEHKKKLHTLVRIPATARQ
jgi:hypothetical protein